MSAYLHCDKRAIAERYDPHPNTIFSLNFYILVMYKESAIGEQRNTYEYMMQSWSTDIQYMVINVPEAGYPCRQQTR